MQLSDIEDRFINRLTEVQFPTTPVEPVGTVRPGAMEGETSAIPRSEGVGMVADFVRNVRDLANQYEIKDWVPLLGGLGVGDLLLGKSPEEIENWAYGNAPMVMPPSGTGGYIPVVKTGRKEGLADAAMLGIDVAGMSKGTGMVAKGVGRGVTKAANLAGDKAVQAITGNPQATAMGVLEEAGQMSPLSNVVANRSVSITSAEKQAIETAAGADKKFQRLAIDEARRVKGNYPKNEGWAPIEIAGGKTKGAKFEVEAKKIPYNFHTPPGKMGKDRWEATMASRVVDEVQQIVDRAAAGDKAAMNILAEANWYRSMRDRLRAEFGGIGDVFADLLGATSAQTGVEQNFDNAIEILRRFSRGEFDAELAAYEARLASGQPVDSKTLNTMFKQGDFPLITKATGQLFNANSPAATGALLDLFRAVKAGDAPKTPNFTGNLIGLTNEATVDVWAARMLRRLSGQPTIPPPAEKGVAGKHLVGSDIYNPRVGSEFGFGQSVFRDAADQINQSGVIKDIMPDVGDVGPDDLQAVAWFIEKERWTRKGWTTKAGEGGSLDYEMNLAGQPNADRVKELRRTIASGKTSAEDKAAAQAELNDLMQPADRFTLGVSAERPGMRPSNYQQAELAAEFDDVVRDDASVIGYKLTNTYGRFMRADERALDAEFVVKSSFNPEPLLRRLVEMGKQYDQDAVFMSKVVRDGASPNARPGVEIYFKKRQGADFVRQVTDKLNEYGVDGFTFVTDLRQSDRVNVQAMAGGADTAGLTGIRFQYIPEFDDAFTEANRAAIIEQKEDLFQDIVGDILRSDDVSDARVVYYDTQVYFRSDYDEYLARAAGQADQAQGGARPPGASAAQPDRSGEVRARSAGTVSNRVGKATPAKQTSTVKRGQAPAMGAE
jgi:hypothetical protein